MRGAALARRAIKTIPRSLWAGDRLSDREPLIPARALLARAGLVDGESPVLKLGTVQPLDGALGMLVRHLDKAKAAAPASLPVSDQAYGFNLDVRLVQKEFAQGLLRG
jgi:hypothetical protein